MSELAHRVVARFKGSQVEDHSEHIESIQIIAPPVLFREYDYSHKFFIPGRKVFQGEELPLRPAVLVKTLKDPTLKDTTYARRDDA